MPHNPAGKNAVTQDSLNGLITNCDPQDLPQGASPWSQNSAYITGSVSQRGGLVSSYSFPEEFEGPNGGGAATDVATPGGTAWTSPNNILRNDGSYASISIGAAGAPTQIPSSAVNGLGTYPWTNPANVRSTSGSSSAATISLTIPTTPPGPPVINSFTATPSIINAGQNSTLSWTTTNTTSVTLNGVSVPLNGSSVVHPTTTTVYTLIATGTSSVSQNFGLIVNTTPPPPPAPTITASGNPTLITNGNNSLLTWSSINATTVTMAQNGLNPTSVGLSGTAFVHPTVDTNFVFVATGTGGSATTTVTIIVQQQQPPPCFSGNVGVLTPTGFVLFRDLPRDQPFEITNETGVHSAELLVHDHSGTMIDMGDGLLVTPEHLMKSNLGDYIPAEYRFADCERVHFVGEVFNIHVLDAEPEDMHYILSNDEVAHNFKVTNPPPLNQSIIGELDPVESAPLIASGFTFNIPANATILGITVNATGYATNVSGVPSLFLQLSSSGVLVGNVLAQNLTPFAAPPTPQPFVFGGGANLWGTTNFSPSNINNLGVVITAQVSGNPGVSNNFTLNGLTVTITYQAQGISDPLNVTQFGLNTSATSGVSGIEVSLTGFQNGLGIPSLVLENGFSLLTEDGFPFLLENADLSDASTSHLSVQMMKAGVPTGTAQDVELPLLDGTLTLGGDNFLWGTTWSFIDVNNPNFGVRIIAEGETTQFLDYATVKIYQTPALANFNYIKSFEQTAQGNYYTLALDNDGILWQDNVVTAPGQLVSVLESITPGSFMNSTTLDDVEWMCFSDQRSGTDVPRHYDGSTFERTSHCGVGASPNFQSTLASTTQATITAFQITSNIVTLTATNSFTAGEVVRITGLSTATYLNNLSFDVLGTGLSGSQFQINFVHANVSHTSDSGTATAQYGYPITNITQNASQPFNGQVALWSAGPGSTDAGTTITFYYGSANGAADTILTNAFNTGIGVFVFVTGAPFGNGTFLVTSVGAGKPPHETGTVNYFTVQTTSSAYQQFGGPGQPGNDGSYQMTVATMTNSLPIPSVSVGDQIVVTGVNVSGWNRTWTITNLLKSGVFNITQTQMDSTGTATYTWSLVSGSAPAAGQLVTVSNTLNGNGIFNVTDAVISSATGSSSGTFTISGFPPAAITAAPETGQAQTAGTQFQFEPGLVTLGSTTSPIYGTGTGGLATVVGGSSQAIGAGTRKGVVFFEYASGFQTAPSPPLQFTTLETSNYILASQIPVGPTGVIRRWIAFTEAGANGVPGANYYVIPTPISYTIGNQNYQYSATVINDNITTVAKFTFTDGVLLAGQPIDVDGNNLFNQIELGSSLTNMPYAGRMMYLGELNKVQNFLNLSFDGGYNPNPGANLSPLGWGVDSSSNPLAGNPATITAFNISSNLVTFTAANNFVSGQQVYINSLSVGTYLNGQTLIVGRGPTSSQFAASFVHANVGTTTDSGTATPVNIGATLVNSPVVGMAYYITNTSARTQSTLGMIVQSAYQDAFLEPILNINTAYGVRVACSNPSGNTNGSLVVDLTDFNAGGTGYGTTYGSFSIPFSSMTGSVQTFTGTLLTTPFTKGVPTGLYLRVYASTIGYGADVMIDRVEPFPTDDPVLTTNCRVSYIDNFEAFDGVTGNIGLAESNSQPAYGMFEMFGRAYFLKSGSMSSSQDAPGSEPNDSNGNPQWSVIEVSPTVGTCGVNAYDYGEEWLVTACRNGLFGFNGGTPMRIDFQQKEIWESINWKYAQTICVRNDLLNRIIRVSVPMPTPNRWLPLAPSNPNPTTPNVVMTFNYQGLGSFNELVTGQGIHVTMFGTLASLDMRIKVSLDTISTPYMGFITTTDLLTRELQICNGAANSKIYHLDDSATSDDGAAIPWFYATSPFTESSKKQPVPESGMGQHRAQYSQIQQLVAGVGSLQITAYPEYILDPKTLKFNGSAWAVPSLIPLTTAGADIWLPLNITANRMFVLYSCNTVGSGGTISKIITDGIMAPFGSVNPNAW